MNTIVNYYNPIQQHFIKSGDISPTLIKPTQNPGFSPFSLIWSAALWGLYWRDFINLLQQTYRFFGGRSMAPYYYSNPEFFGPISHTIYPVSDSGLAISNANKVLKTFYK